MGEGYGTVAGEPAEQEAGVAHVHEGWANVTGLTPPQEVFGPDLWLSK
ncbi:hypothetical protein [Streptomyces sp. NPDC015345]